MPVLKWEVFRGIVRVEKYPIEVSFEAVLAGARLSLVASPVVPTSLSLAGYVMSTLPPPTRTAQTNPRLAPGRDPKKRRQNQTNDRG